MACPEPHTWDQKKTSIKIKNVLLCGKTGLRDVEGLHMQQFLGHRKEFVFYFKFQGRA